MNNIFKQIDFKGGFLFNENSCVFDDVPLENQEYNLIEDIAQIIYRDKDSIVDVGWYPEDFKVDAKSYFLIQVVTSGQWDEPAYKMKLTDATGLKRAIEDAVSFIIADNQSSNA